jgi:Tfp pilus assembly protein PilN
VESLTLATWANIADIIGAGSIVTGLTVGWIQIRHLRRQQREAVAINLAQTFYSHDLAQAIALLQPLPDGITLTQIRAMGKNYECAAITVCTSFETMGLLAFKRIAPMDLVLDLAGGIVGVMTKKLRQWNEDIRAEQQQPSFGEWFEWLGDQALQRKPLSAPAHIQHQHWNH